MQTLGNLIKMQIDVQKNVNYNDEDPRQFHSRIEQILGRTRNKLKLEAKSPVQKFNENLLQFKSLSTFYETKAKLNRLNIMNDDELFSKVKRYLIKRKLTKQFPSDHDDLQEAYQQIEQQFDKVVEDEDAELHYLDFGEFSPKHNQQPLHSKFQPRLHLTNLVFANRSTSLPNITLPNRLDPRKSQFEQGQFYFTVEELLAHNEQSKIQRQISEKLHREEALRKQAQQEKELVQVVKKYGIDLESPEQLEEHIYNSFRQKAKALIAHRLLEAKRKYQARLQADKIKKVEVKPRRGVKLSAIIEHKLFGTPLRLVSPQHAVEHPTALTQKRTQIRELRTLRRQSTMLLSEFASKTSELVAELNPQVQRHEYEEMAKDLSVMESQIEDVYQRVNFQEKLSSLGFSKEEAVHVKSSHRVMGQTQKLLRRKHERSIRLFRFENM